MKKLVKTGSDCNIKGVDAMFRYDDLDNGLITLGALLSTGKLYYFVLPVVEDYVFISSGFVRSIKCKTVKQAEALLDERIMKCGRKNDIIVFNGHRAHREIHERVNGDLYVDMWTLYKAAPAWTDYIVHEDENGDCKDLLNNRKICKITDKISIANLLKIVKVDLKAVA